MSRVRSIDRVEDALHAGPDAEVDDKWLHVRPGDPRTAPFLVLSEDRISAPGFEWHPHRGIETVTVVLDGVLEHEDDAGGAGVLDAGDAQWMTAGRGIVHREVAASGAHAAHVLQLWRELPADARSAPPGHQQLRAGDRPRLVRPGTEIDVLAGTVNGVDGPARPAAPAQVVLVTLAAGAALDLPVPRADRAFALVLEGDAEVAGAPVRARRTAWSEPAGGTYLPLRSGATGARLLVASAPPGPSHTNRGART